MPQFEIHGDDKNGITVRAHGYERTFQLVYWQEERGPFVTCRIDGHPFPIPDVSRLVLDMYPQPEPLDATPTVYGEGTWLH